MIEIILRILLVFICVVVWAVGSTVVVKYLVENQIMVVSQLVKNIEDSK